LSISEVSEKDMRNLRGPEIAMILQEPMAHLNPVFTVGYQIGESLARHRHLKQDELQRDKRCPKGSSDTEPVEDKRQLPI
jgi:ABC-type microcin C transport system duplicated ATPase subunit YejF